MKNLNKIFYKEYFADIKFKNLLDDGKFSEDDCRKIVKVNKELCSTTFDGSNKIPCPDMVNETLPLKVLYPGLVTGVGINHEANIKGEFKLGMHFDTTYGQPIIYGSSVKGVLRAYFKDIYPKETEDMPSEKDAINDIFEGKGKSLYNSDVFFDAVICKGDNKGHILSTDSITPHKDALKNPIPLTFLKIASGCTIEFRFKLVDSNINGRVIHAEQKKKWFKEILTTYGIGAKTNVGYGQLA